MTRRTNSWVFGHPDNKSTERRAQQRLDRARKRQLAADKKRLNKSIRMEKRIRKRQEMKWHRAEQRRKRADDKRVKMERRKWQKQ